MTRIRNRRRNRGPSGRPPRRHYRANLQAMRRAVGGALASVDPDLVPAWLRGVAVDAGFPASLFDRPVLLEVPASAQTDWTPGVPSPVCDLERFREITRLRDADGGDARQDRRDAWVGAVDLPDGTRAAHDARGRPVFVLPGGEVLVVVVLDSGARVLEVLDDEGAET